MANKEETIKTLQAIVTGLSANSIQHRFQSKIFESQGFTKLSEKYIEHAEEEMGFVEQFIDRIIDLDGEIKQESLEEKALYDNIVDFLNADKKESVDGLAVILQIMESGILDITTYDLMKEYYKDEEEDLYWTESQLELIDRIGLENYLNNQL